VAEDNGGRGAMAPPKTLNFFIIGILIFVIIDIRYFDFFIIDIKSNILFLL